MSNSPDQQPQSRFVTTGPSNSSDCQVLVDSAYAESFIGFLKNKDIKLTPPDGGVIIPIKWQVEKEGKPQIHSFFANAQPSEILSMAAEWEKLGLGQLPRHNAP